MSNAASTGGASSEVEPMEVQASTETETKAEMTSLPVAKLLPVSIEEKVFGGKIQTSYECCRCHTVSIHNETFNDLLLPFPDSKETSVKPSTATVAPATEPDASPAETTETSESATSSEPSESTSQTVPAKSALTMQVNHKFVFASKKAAYILLWRIKTLFQHLVLACLIHNVGPNFYVDLFLICQCFK